MNDFMEGIERQLDEEFSRMLEETVLEETLKEEEKKPPIRKAANSCEAMFMDN